MTVNDTAQACAAYVRKAHAGPMPTTAIILGSGLGAFADSIDAAATIPYSDIPGFPRSTVAGHAGRLIVGAVDGVPILCMQGRMHLYEGYSAQTLAIPIRTLKLLGVETLVLTNAAGGLLKDKPAGSLMVIEDHINFSGANPLIGENDESVGPRFFDMSNAYDRSLRQSMMAVAQQQNIDVFSGIYVQVAGPNFETPAEVKMFAAMGAHAVGMSTVPECLVAVHCGMRVVGVSLISNLAAGISTNPLSHEEVFEEAQKAEGRFTRLLVSFLKAKNEDVAAGR